MVFSSFCVLNAFRAHLAVQDDLEGHQDGLKTTQDPPRTLQDALKTLPRRPKTLPRRPKTLPRRFPDPLRRSKAPLGACFLPKVYLSTTLEDVRIHTPLRNIFLLGPGAEGCRRHLDPHRALAAQLRVRLAECISL